MSRKGFPSDKQDQFMLRLPDGMRDRIKAAAEANNRSMNAEIVAMLEEKYPAPAIPSAEAAELFRVALYGESEAERAAAAERITALAREAGGPLLIEGVRILLDANRQD